MTKIFIDTEKFIELYWTSKDITKVIEDFNKLKPYLIVTEQVIDEFYRNRDAQIIQIIDHIESFKFEQTLGNIALIRKSPNYVKIRKLQDEIKILKREIVNEFNKIYENSDDDIVFQFFTELIKDPSVTIIKRNETVIKKAQKRKLIGNPPISQDKNSVGDEINWESILSEIDDDLIIVSNDLTYFNHRTFLMNEFFISKSRKRKIIGFYKEISKVLSKVNEKPSKELIKFEKEQKAISQDITSFGTLPSILNIPNYNALSQAIEAARMSQWGALSQATEAARMSGKNKRKAHKLDDQQN